MAMFSGLLVQHCPPQLLPLVKTFHLVLSGAVLTGPSKSSQNCRLVKVAHLGSPVAGIENFSALPLDADAIGTFRALVDLVPSSTSKLATGIAALDWLRMATPITIRAKTIINARMCTLFNLNGTLTFFMLTLIIPIEVKYRKPRQWTIKIRRRDSIVRNYEIFYATSVIII